MDSGESSAGIKNRLDQKLRRDPINFSQSISYIGIFLPKMNRILILYFNNVFSDLILTWYNGEKEYYFLVEKI